MQPVNQGEEEEEEEDDDDDYDDDDESRASLKPAKYVRRSTPISRSVLFVLSTAATTDGTSCGPNYEHDRKWVIAPGLWH